MPSSREHPWDAIPKELASYITDEAKWYAEALKGGGPAPFAARASEEEKIEYYRRQLYTQNPDGTIDYEKPNMQGRQQLITRVGIDNYALIARTVGPGKSALTDVKPDEEYSDAASQSSYEE